VVKRRWMAVFFVLAGCVGTVRGQPTITSVTNVSGESYLCAGGVALVHGSGLGTSTSIAVTAAGKKAYVKHAANSFLLVELPVDAPQGATTIQVGNSAAFAITLGEYCPGIPSNTVNGEAYVYARHDNDGLPVTVTFPSIPREMLDIFVTGLGPTTPVYATGTAPAEANVVTNGTPSVQMSGLPAKVVDSYLAPNNPGVYLVRVITPATATSGNQSVTVSIGGLTSNAVLLPLTTGGAVAGVTNAASFINPALPNGAMAQGSIAVVFGKNLGPPSLAIDGEPLHHTSLAGSSVAITVGGTTVAGLMYYTSFNQAAFLVPSNTPVGTGTITVTYNGQAGAPAPITIAQSTVGIFTVSSDGQGAGILTYGDYSLVSATKAANCGGANTTCGAANPGDLLTIWATGLGPVNGSDAAGAGLGENMPQIPLTIWLGGVAVQASYQGRSGCCIGVDQIQFRVPANAPLGCAVPLSVETGGNISNTVAAPIAAAGSRTCVPANPQFTADLVAPVSTGSGPFTFADIELQREDQDPGLVDKVKAQLARFTIPSGVQPYVFTYLDDPPPGSCQVYGRVNGSTGPPINIVGGLDAGPQLTVQGPNGTKNVPGSHGTYNGTISTNGSYLVAGSYIVSVPGGADVAKFSVPVTIPAMPTMTFPAPDAKSPTAVTRADGLTVTWTGGQANELIQIEGFSATDNTYSAGADFLCSVTATAGTFTIPPSVLLAMPGGNFGGLWFRSYVMPVSISGTGLTVANLNVGYGSFAPVNYQ
jgi:uncharacterized protein (TIGR03437 family)